MDIQIRKGTIDDTEKIIRFLEEIRSGMQHPEWFFLDSPEVVRGYMRTGKMHAWLALDGDRIVAIFDYLIPGTEKFNYGYDLGFSAGDLLRVINLDNAAVHPTYRGRGLQRKMLQMAEEYLRASGSYILLCTVHPDNIYSLQNVLGRGYSIQKQLDKYNSTRYILRKDI